MTQAVPNAALARMRSGQLALGLGVGLLPATALPRLARNAGFHWLAIDREHSPLGPTEAASLSMAALAAGVAPIVRTKFEALHDGVRDLDAGAQGLLVPNVESAEQARRIVAMGRFPPLGSRGWGGAAPNFGFAPPRVDEAIVALNDETLLAPMIETRVGLENVDSIAAVPGIDVVFVGTTDLSLDLKLRGGAGDTALWNALDRISSACRRHGKALGVGGLYDEVSLPRLMALGTRLLAVGSDQGFLMQAARARVDLIERLTREPEPS